MNCWMEFEKILLFFIPFIWHLVNGLDTPVAYAQENLRIHNLFRARHPNSNAPLVLNNKLSEMAERWAKSIGADADEAGIATAVKRPAYDNDNPRYGDNIGGLDASVADAVKDDGGYPVRQWYREFIFHNFKPEMNSYNEATSHFSQIVWRGSKQLGVGRYITPKGNFIIVCIYQPSGNFNYRESFISQVQNQDATPIWDNWMNDKNFIKYLDNGGEALYLNPPTG